MIRLLTATLLVASFSVVADTEVPHRFEDGTPAKAAEVNANFDALEAAIDAIPEGPAGATGPAGADGEDGATGPAGADGADGADGATGPAGADGADGADGATGPAGATGATGPTGADGVVNGVTCTTDQVIVYRDSAWGCSSPELREYGGRSADCPSGKKVTGGGCDFGNLYDCLETYSRPAGDLSYWTCEVFGLGGGLCAVRRAYAICQ